MSREPTLYVPNKDLIHKILNDANYDLDETLYAHLAESGINAETAHDLQFRRIPSGTGCLNGSWWRELLNMRMRSEWGDCLFIPYFDGAGNCIYVRLRPQWPGGKPDGAPKYLGPAGTAVRMYFTPQIIKQMNELSKQIDSKRYTTVHHLNVYIFEGEKKAARAYQEGMFAVAIPGCQMGLKPGSKYCLHPDFQRFDWKNSKVTLVPDSDINDNKNIKNGFTRLGRAFQKAGAVVYRTTLSDKGGDPNSFDGSPTKIDDLSKDEFQKALAVENLELLDKKPNAGSVAPEELRQQYLDSRPNPLVFHHNLYEHSAEDCCYVERADREEESRAYKWLCDTHQQVSTRQSAELLRAVKLQLTGPLSIPSPFWVDSAPAGFENLKECIILRDVVLNLRTGETTPNSPDLFTTYAVPVVYDPNAGSPSEFLDHIYELLRHDHQVEMLQEFIGLSLTPETKYQKFLYMHGKPGAGKGTLMRIWKYLLGDDNVYATNIKVFGSDFGLAPALGKMLIALNDEKRASGRELIAAKGWIDNITGEDDVPINNKYEKIKSVFLSAKLAIVVNDLINFQDEMDSGTRRILPFKAYAPEKPRDVETGRSERIFENEAAGILNWAIEGWHRLLQNNRFTEMPLDGPGWELLRDQRHLNSMVADFCNEYCVKGVGLQEKLDELWIAWKDKYCLLNNIKEPGTRRQFLTRFRAYMGVEHGKGPSEKGPGDKRIQPPVYIGVRLKTQNELFDDKYAPSY